MNKEYYDRIRRINPAIVHGYEKIDTFKEQIFDIMTGKYNYQYPCVISTDSEAIPYIGGVRTDVPMIINPNKIHSIAYEHGLNYGFIGGLCDLMKKSVLAFDSMTQGSSRVIMLPWTDWKDDIVIAICRPGWYRSGMETNQITSIYGKKNIESFIERSFENGCEFYTNEKTEAFIRHTRLQLPNYLTNALCSNDSIKNDANQENTIISVTKDDISGGEKMKYIDKRYEKYIPKVMRDHLVWLERVDNECDRSHVYFVTFEYNGKEYSLEPCDTVDEIRWYAKDLNERLQTPDPEYNYHYMRIYGYTWDGMLPMGKERAMELFQRTDAEIFRLYQDGTEAAVENISEIEDAKEICLWGIEKESWEKIKDSVLGNEVSERAVINEDPIPESELAAYQPEKNRSVEIGRKI